MGTVLLGGGRQSLVRWVQERIGIKEYCKYGKSLNKFCSIRVTKKAVAGSSARVKEAF